MVHILEHLSQDRHLGTIIPSITLFEEPHNQDVYLSLLSSIISQQLSTKAAETIRNRFFALFPHQYPSADLVVNTDIHLLRSVGLSQQKASYMHNVARFHLDKGIHFEQLNTMTDEEIIIYLTQIKGVGKWTVEMLLMFTLERLDVFPIDDLGIQNAITRLYQLNETGKQLKSKLMEIAESWKPYRTVACKYLWRWKDGE